MRRKLDFIKLAFLLVIFISLASCTAPAPQVIEDDIQPKLDKYANIWDEVLNNGNIEMINETTFMPDAVIYSGNEPVVGLENVKAVYTAFLSGFSDIEFTIHDIFGQGDRLVKHFTFKAVHTGEYHGIPATDSTVVVEGVTIVKMNGDRIAEEKDFFDNLQVLMQLGVIPKK